MEPHIDVSATDLGKTGCQVAVLVNVHFGPMADY
jgi:hypothetical protein